VSEELKKELSEYKLTNKLDVVKASMILHRVDKKTVWPRTQRSEAYVEYAPTNVEIELPNKDKAYLWVIYKKAHNNSGDDMWAFLSFEEKNRKLIENFVTLVDRMRVESHVKNRTIRVYGGANIKIRGSYTWDDLILTDHIIRSVKDDLEFWMRMEQHYKDKKIPYRRGYIFEGPPGNGKTATARVIMSMYDFTGFMFNFSNQRLDDSDLMEAFSQAASEAPSIFILEDIDRVFDKTHFCNITLECLFNCLDGISVNEGLVVVATANHPETLDKAIRQRPGRFDVPVRFDNPDYDQRLRFFDRMFGNALSAPVFTHLVEATEDMSMAFLKLVYETAGVNAFKRISNGEFEIIDKDAIAGLELSLKYYKQMSVGDDRQAGFKTDATNKRMLKGDEECTQPKCTDSCETVSDPPGSPVRRIYPTKEAPG
jgi:SpoVK/Ycf46/Vps4 family AAA+-type ATPase